MVRDEIAHSPPLLLPLLPPLLLLSSSSDDNRYKNGFSRAIQYLTGRLIDPLGDRFKASELFRGASLFNPHVVKRVSPAKSRESTRYNYKPKQDADSNEEDRTIVAIYQHG